MLIGCVLRTVCYIISSTTGLLFIKHNGLIHRHALSQHGNKSDQKHQCDMCDKGFNNRQALEGHKNWHLNLKPFQCRLASNSSLITSQGSTVYIFPPANKDENLIVYNPKRQTFKAFYLVFDAIFSFLLFPFFIFPPNLQFLIFPKWNNIYPCYFILCLECVRKYLCRWSFNVDTYVVPM